jgi:hypothetical protein
MKALMCALVLCVSAVPAMGQTPARAAAPAEQPAPAPRLGGIFKANPDLQSC